MQIIQLQLQKERLAKNVGLIISQLQLESDLFICFQLPTKYWELAY